MKLISLAKKRLRILDVLPQSPANCGAVAVIFLNRAEHLRYHLTGVEFSDEEAREYTHKFEKYIRLIDPDWICGRNIHFDLLQNEDRNMGRLRPYGPLNTQDLITKCVEMVQTIIFNTVKDINPTTKFLLNKAKLFARTAWRQARWQRFDELEHQKEKSYVTQSLQVDSF